MDATTLLNLAGVVCLSVVASVAVLWISGLIMGTKERPQAVPETDETPETTILFRHGLIADHDCKTPGIFSDIADWADLRTWFGQRFERLPDILPDDAASLEVYHTVDRMEDHATVTIKASGGVVRVTLADPKSSQPAERHHALCLRDALGEDQTALQSAPCAIWKTDKDGIVIWQNDACTKLLDEQVSKVLDGIDSPVNGHGGTHSRVAIAQPHSDAQTWFDVHGISTDLYQIYYATDITNAVHAEAAQREFVQTLTKTFANLTTGLAIFDRNQQLALFNPALVDLTALPAEFLSGRPSLMSFFDNLRDRQVMPEPKSYSLWRAQINSMIATATDGLYQETWSLPSGVTYRITGRPHPDGAVAFLFEDISAEISLTRRFRAQNDLRQAVLDKLDHAVAVIASNNVVIFCNATWTEMFGIDPDTSFAELGIRDLVATCRQKFPHPEFWKTVETQTTCKTLSHPIEETIEVDGSAPLHCRLIPVAGGAALICRPCEAVITHAPVSSAVS
ncbi:Sensor protein DivL [Roseovarius aestuarii]|uniref:Sensor protein DivL n=2 Tax=Roseovarius aestuarii TaxID=475083 RepID=A0A1X7BS93_9RHOB|nr:Sensor protein DivL [Roseovarius aestuarii]